MKTSDSFKIHLIDDPDKVIAAIFAVVGLLVLTLTLLGGKSFVIQASVLAFPSIMYLALSRSRKTTWTTSATFPIATLTPAFFGMLGIGTLVYLYYDATAGVATISLTGVFIMVQILLMGSAWTLSHRVLVLVETFIVSLALRLLPSFSNPGFIAGDPWVLSTTSIGILETGRMMPYFSYADFPIYNILISMGSMVSFLDVRVSTLLLIGFAQSFSLFFVYLIAKRVWDCGVGLVASFFYAVTPSSVLWGVIPIPMSLGITLTIFLAALLVLGPESNHAKSYRSLAVLLVATITLTHSLTSAVMVLILIAMAVSPYLLSLWKKLESSQHGLKFSQKFNTIAALALVFTFTYWTYVATTIFSGSAVTLFSILGVYYPKETFIQSYIAPVSLLKVLIEDLSLILLYFLAAMGLFLVFSKGETKNAFLHLTITEAIFGVSVGLPFLGITSGSTMLSERWEAFLFAFLVCLSARTLYYVRGKLSVRTALILFVIVGALMIPSTALYNQENLEKHWRPSYFLSSELFAGKWVKDHLTYQDVASDSRLKFALGTETKNFGHQIISGNITYVIESLPNSVLLVSAYSFRGGRIEVPVEREVFGWGGANVKLPYNIDSFLDNPYYNRYFSNGIVSSYEQS